MPRPTRERIKSAIDAMLYHDPKLYPERRENCIEEVMHVIDAAWPEEEADRGSEWHAFPPRLDCVRRYSAIRQGAVARVRETSRSRRGTDGPCGTASRCWHATWETDNLAAKDARYLPFLLTPERVFAIGVLLAEPWAWEEDGSVEEAT